MFTEEMLHQCQRLLETSEEHLERAREATRKMPGGPEEAAMSALVMAVNDLHTLLCVVVPNQPY